MVWKKKPKQAQEEPIRDLEARPVSANKSAASTRLGASLVIHGEVRCDEDMLVSGKLIGQVHCGKQIIVATSGYIEGEISCRSILISGQVKGDVVAKDGITIEATGRLRGDITTKILTNQPGGFFEGYSHMIDDKPQPKKTRKRDEVYSASPSSREDGKDDQVKGNRQGERLDTEQE